ncbi:hypothetical protein VTK26DRAFT_4854 [Humicola hyalothermophila]
MPIESRRTRMKSVNLLAHPLGVVLRRSLDLRRLGAEPAPLRPPSSVGYRGRLMKGVNHNRTLKTRVRLMNSDTQRLDVSLCNLLQTRMIGSTMTATSPRKRSRIGVFAPAECQFLDAACVNILAIMSYEYLSGMVTRPCPGADCQPGSARPDLTVRLPHSNTPLSLSIFPEPQTTNTPPPHPKKTSSPSRHPTPIPFRAAMSVLSTHHPVRPGRAAGPARRRARARAGPAD